MPCPMKASPDASVAISMTGPAGVVTTPPGVRPALQAVAVENWILYVWFGLPCITPSTDTPPSSFGNAR